MEPRNTRNELLRKNPTHRASCIWSCCYSRYITALHGAAAVRLPPAHRHLQAVISLWWTCCPNLWPQLISYTSARFIHRTDYRFYTLLSAVITKCHRPNKKTNVKIQGGQEAGMSEVLADSYRAKTQGGALQCNGKESPPAGSYQAFQYLTFFFKDMMIVIFPQDVVTAVCLE